MFSFSQHRISIYKCPPLQRGRSAATARVVDGFMLITMSRVIGAFITILMQTSRKIVPIAAAKGTSFESRDSYVVIAIRDGCTLNN